MYETCIFAGQLAHQYHILNICSSVVPSHALEQQPHPSPREIRRMHFFAALRDTIRQYYIKVADAQPIGGLPEAKNWVLRGPQNDTLGLHEHLAMSISRALDWWAPRTQYTEVWDPDPNPGPTTK